MDHGLLLNVDQIMCRRTAGEEAESLLASRDRTRIEKAKERARCEGTERERESTAKRATSRRPGRIQDLSSCVRSCVFVLLVHMFI